MVVTSLLLVVGVVFVTFPTSCKGVISFMHSTGYEIIYSQTMHRPTLVPSVQSLSLREGVCRIDDSATIAYDDKSLQPIAQYLASHLGLRSEEHTV